MKPKEEKQDKFWEIYDLLVNEQDSWTQLSAKLFEQWIIAQAAGLGMKMSQFQSDLKSEESVAKVQKAVDDNQKVGLTGAPLIIISGDLYT